MIPGFGSREPGEGGAEGIVWLDGVDVVNNAAWQIGSTISGSDRSALPMNVLVKEEIEAIQVRLTRFPISPHDCVQRSSTPSGEVGVALECSSHLPWRKHCD